MRPLTVQAPKWAWPFITRPRMVAAIVKGTAGLELSKDEFQRLAPVEGMYGEHGAGGAVIVRGNSLPEFSYQVFDVKLMEFVHMKARLALPARIEFEAKTFDLGEVSVKRAYQKPFLKLARHLARYFPLLPQAKGDARVIG
jgi:hypothetical protein